MSKEFVLEMKDISKRFPGVIALDNVSLNSRRGEVLGLVGQNGAGKSTLIKILDGVYAKDSGKIIIEGKTETLKHPSDAFKIGIRVIHQELNSFDSLTVIENIFAGEMITSGLLKRVNWKEMVDKTYEVLQNLGIEIDPRTVMAELNTAQKQLVELAKAIWKKGKILVMDEPTSALGRNDIKVLFNLIKRLKQSGISIIYISHRLEEVFEVTDRVMVLRDGKNVGTLKTKETDRNELITLMVGRKISEMYPKRKISIGDAVLHVKDFTLQRAFSGINFSLRQGEILGIFGLLGCGKDKIIESVYGLLARDAGTLASKDKQLTIKNPADSTQNQIGFMPVDRKKDGLALSMKIKENIVMANTEGLGDGWFIARKIYHEKVQKWINALNIKTPGLDTRTESLSGGNQQKVVMAKCLEAGSKIIIMNEPTRGVDVGAKVEIYKIMEDLCEQGVSIIMLSSDLPEIMSLADRIIVIGKGRITAEYKFGEYSQGKLLHAANL